MRQDAWSFLELHQFLELAALQHLQVVSFVGQRSCGPVHLALVLAIILCRLLFLEQFVFFLIKLFDFWEILLQLLGFLLLSLFSLLNFILDRLLLDQRGQFDSVQFLPQLLYILLVIFLDLLLLLVFDFCHMLVEFWSVFVVVKLSFLLAGHQLALLLLKVL